MRRRGLAMHLDKSKQNNIKRLVLFDIDQTLISNGGAGRKALYRALQATMSIDLNRPEIADIRMSGKTDPQIVREFIKLSNLDQSQTSDTFWQKIISETIDHYLKFLPEEIDLVSSTPNYFMHNGVMEILQLLEKDEQIALGLLTGNIEQGARIKLSRFDLNRFFPIGAYGCDSANRLDLPAIAHKRAQNHYQLDLMPAQIIIIGDAENDVLCAKHYGAISVAINTGTTSWQELAALEPNYLFSALTDTNQILNAIMSDTNLSRAKL
jgi:phosphoglycolate phosphatase